MPVSWGLHTAELVRKAQKRLPFPESPQDQQHLTETSRVFPPQHCRERPELLPLRMVLQLHGSTVQKSFGGSYALPSV